MKKTKIDHYTDKEALEFHSHKKPGKIEIVASKNMITKRDLALAYSPGVAAPVKKISENPETAYDSLQTSTFCCLVCNPHDMYMCMYFLQTHETHYFSLLRTDSVCKLNAIVCRFKCAHYIVFANQSSLQTAQHSAGTKKRLPSCARAGEDGPMGIRRRSWEIMGDTGQGGNQRIDRGDRGRSREIKLRSGDVDRG